MRSNHLVMIVISVVIVVDAACSSDRGGGAGGKAGSAAGASSAVGGARASGGSIGGSGGAASTGGATGVAGGTGGVPGRGGQTDAGGTTATGGQIGSGGTNGSAGTTGTGGTVGGRTGSGDTSTAGGTSVSGGRTGSGGATTPSTGGAAGGTQAGGSMGLADTPPMGWNSWNQFGCTANDSTIRAAADAMVSNGMKDAGYQYVNIDDCWQASRDGSGIIVPDPNFPDMKALADYVHSKGLKLGIYSDRGTKTCSGRPGSEGYETQDANTYAAWGIDYLKYDSCNATLDSQTQYTTMSNALKASGRPIVFSICAWYFMSWMPSVGQLWRTTTDIKATWSSITSILDVNAGLAQYAGPGHWNDPDMLEVGNSALTENENRAHFGIWAMMAAPLIAGNDLRNMSASVKAVLTASEIIAVDQDSLGVQGTRIKGTGALEVWKKKLGGTNTMAVALFNRTGAPADISVTWSELGLPAGTATVRDLWAKSDLGPATDSYTAKSVPSHGITMLKLTSQ